MSQSLINKHNKHNKHNKRNNQKTLKKVFSMILAGGFLVTGNLITNLVMASKEISVLKNYADIAGATYEVSLITAKILKKTITLLTANPTEANLQAAKKLDWLLVCLISKLKLTVLVMQ